MLGASFKTQSIVRNSSPRKPYLRLSVYIIVTAVLLYSQFIFGDRVLAYSDWGYDTYGQYVPSYEFISTYIRNGTISEYTFQNGLGTSSTKMLSIICGPFSAINILIGVLFGSQYIADCIVYTQILKILCAGLLTFYYLRRLNFSEKASMISAYIYSFSGYMMTAGQHYFFSCYPVYNMLLLIVLEKILLKKCKIGNWITLSIVVALICIRGIQSAFITLLAAAVYFIVRLVHLYGKDFCGSIKKLGQCAFFVVEGILLLFFWLLPQADVILSSPRLSGISLGSSVLSSFSPASSQIIKSSFLRLFSNSLEGTVNSWSGGTYHWEMFSCFFTALLVPAAAQFLWNTFTQKFSVKDKVIRIIPIIAVVFAIINNFIPSLFNVFAYPTYRYVFVFLPLFAIAFADTLDRIYNGVMNRLLNYIVAAVSCVVIIWGGYGVYKTGNTSVDFPICIAVAAVISGCVIFDLIYLSQRIESESDIKQKIQKTLSVALSLVIAINLFSENYITLYFGRSVITKTLMHSPMLNEEAVDYIKGIEKDNFYRYETGYREGKMPDYSYSYTLDVPTTAFYNTTVNSNIIDFYNNLLPVDLPYNIVVYKELKKSIGDPTAKDLLGLKYYLSSPVINDSSWEEVKRFENDLILYKNKSINSMGLLFDNYITDDESAAISISDRQLGLNNRLIISDPSENINNFAVPCKELSYEKVEAFDSNNISAFEGAINSVEQKSNGETLFNAVAIGSTSVIIPLNTGIVGSGEYQTSFTVTSDNAIPISYLCYSDPTGTWISISAKKTDTDDGKTAYTFSVPTSALSLGIALDGKGSTGLSVSSQAIKKAYSGEGISLKCPKMGDKVFGTVNASKNSLLYLPINYESNWKAYIDGEQVEIYKANYAFCAIEMPKGEHTVEFSYRNSAYHYGIMISFISILLMFGFLLIRYIIIFRKHRIQKDAPSQNSSE